MSISYNHVHQAISNALIAIALRDEFAKSALQALIIGRSWDHIGDHNALMKVWAESAYGVADAMMAARGQQ